MAGYMFIKLGDNIKGESTDEDYKEQIEMLNFSWGLSQPTSAVSGTGGRTGAAPNFSDFSFMKVVDAASPDIYLHCAQGTHIPKVEIAVLQSAGDNRNPYLKYELEDVIIANCQISGSAGGEKAAESVSLNYGKCKQIYTPISQTGEAGSATERGWNLETNKKM